MPINILSWSMFDQYVENLSLRIKESGREYKYIVGIPRGGLVPAVILSHILKIPMMPMPTIISKVVHHDWLFVDDIADSGKTISELIPKGVDIATVFCKIELEKKPTYYFGLSTKDEWIMFPYERDVNDPVSQVNYTNYHGGLQ